MKALLRSPLISRLLGLLIWSWMTFVARSTRWQVEGGEGAREAWSDARGLLVPAWHEQILLLPSGWSRQMRFWPKRPGNVTMLVSLSRDAEPVARALDHLGVSTIRGSRANAKKKDKDKGGLRAVAEAVRLLKSGGVLCVTPDGPRGPALEVSSGPLLMAQRAGALILPYALATTHARRLGSWDRMVLPLPFGRGAIVFGAPIQVDGRTTEDLQGDLQTALERANARAVQLTEGQQRSTNMQDAS